MPHKSDASTATLKGTSRPNTPTTTTTAPSSSSSQTCMELWMENHQDAKFIFAFVIGVMDVNKELGLDLKHFDAEQEPFLRRRREYKPTSKVMQKEIVRRAIQAKASRIPRPAQWSGEKLLDGLTRKFPPNLTPQDRTFLRQKCREIYHDAEKRNREESLLQHPLPADWNTDEKYYLRFYHTILELRDSFVLRKWNGNILVPTRGPKFWAALTAKFNNQTWVPQSNVVHGYPDSIHLPFLFSESISQEDLQSVFDAVIARLKVLVANLHERETIEPSFEQGGVVEQYKYNNDDKTQFESQGGIPNHIGYFWQVANNAKLLGSALASTSSAIQDEQIGGDTQEALLLAPPPPALSEEDWQQQQQQQQHQQQQQQQQQQRESNIKHPLTESSILNQAERGGREMRQRSPSPSFLRDLSSTDAADVSFTSDTSFNKRSESAPPLRSPPLDHADIFLEAQKVNLRQMQIYNQLENELFDLELKRIRADTTPQQRMFKTFADRKKASIAQLKQQMNDHLAFSRNLGKRMKLFFKPTTTG